MFDFLGLPFAQSICIVPSETCISTGTKKNKQLHTSIPQAFERKEKISTVYKPIPSQLTTTQVFCLDHISMPKVVTPTSIVPECSWVYQNGSNDYCFDVVADGNTFGFLEQ
jgi:hypothetical protein